MPRDLYKQEASALGVRSRRSSVLEGLPMKGVKRFGMKGKLAPRYIGPFPILEKCGYVAYKLDLPPSLVGVHNIFHMS
jgi:hypothetical protein